MEKSFDERGPRRNRSAGVRDAIVVEYGSTTHGDDAAGMYARAIRRLAAIEAGLGADLARQRLRSGSRHRVPLAPENRISGAAITTCTPTRPAVGGRVAEGRDASWMRAKLDDDLENRQRRELLYLPDQRRAFLVESDGEPVETNPAVF